MHTYTCIHTYIHTYMELVVAVIKKINLGPLEALKASKPIHIV